MTKEELEKESEEYRESKRHKSFRADIGTIQINYESYLNNLQSAYKDGAEPREKRIAELEAQIEKMKCCGNCRFSESDKLNGTFCHREGCFVVASAKCKLWDN